MAKNSFIYYVTSSGPEKDVGKTGTSFTSGRTSEPSTYVKRRSASAIGAVTEFHNPSGWVVTPRVGFVNYPNQVTGLKVLLGTRLPLRASVQSRYMLSDPTGPDRISVCNVFNVRTGVTFMMVKFIIVDSRRNTGRVFY